MSKSQDKITLQEVRDFRAHMFQTSMSLVERKGADYNRDQQEAGDTLFNLRVAALIGAVDTPEQGILVRLSDKLMRLISLTKTAGREAAVKDESVLDTIRDVHNYVDYLGLMWLKSNGLLEDVAPIVAGTPPPGSEDVPEQLELDLDAKTRSETVACLGCLGEKEAHSYDERCSRHVPWGDR